MAKAKWTNPTDEAETLLADLRGDYQDTPLDRLVSRLHATRMMSNAMEQQGIQLNWSMVYRGLCDLWADARRIRDSKPDTALVPEEPTEASITCGAAERNALDRLLEWARLASGDQSTRSSTHPRTAIKKKATELFLQLRQSGDKAARTAVNEQLGTDYSLSTLRKYAQEKE